MVNFPIYAGTRIKLTNLDEGILIDTATGYYQTVGFENQTKMMSQYITTNEIAMVIGAQEPPFEPAPTPDQPSQPTEKPLYCLEITNIPLEIGNWLVDNRDQVWGRIDRTAGLFGWSVPLMQFDADRMSAYLEEKGTDPLTITALAIVAVVITIIAIVFYKVSFNWRVVEVAKNQTVQQESATQQTALTTLKSIRDQIAAKGGDTSEIDRAIIALTEQLPKLSATTSLFGEITQYIPYALGALVLVALINKKGNK